MTRSNVGLNISRLGGGRRRTDRLGGIGPGPVGAGRLFFPLHRRIPPRTAEPYPTPPLAPVCRPVPPSRPTTIAPRVQRRPRACNAVHRRRPSTAHVTALGVRPPHGRRRISPTLGCLLSLCHSRCSAAITRIKVTFSRLIQFLLVLLRNYIY